MCIKCVLYTLANQPQLKVILPAPEVKYTVLSYQPENVGKHTDILTVTHRSSSGR